MKSDSSTPIAFDQTLWKTTVARKNLGLTEKIDSKIFFKKLTMDSDSPTPIAFDQTLSGKHKFGRTDERTNGIRTNSFCYSAYDPPFSRGNLGKALIEITDRCGGETYRLERANHIRQECRMKDVPGILHHL